MSSTSRKPITIRSYGSITDRVERRLYRIERYPLPFRHGLPARAMGYFVALLPVMAILLKLPVTGHLLGLLHWSMTLFIIPGALAWGMATVKLDGRAAHYVAFSIVGWRFRPRVLAGLRRCPDVGTEFAPLHEVQFAPSGDEPRYRRGRVQGAASVVLRYPAKVTVERGPDWTGGRPWRRVQKRLRVEAPGVETRPEREGGLIRIPAGKEIVFE